MTEPRSARIEMPAYLARTILQLIESRGTGRVAINVKDGRIMNGGLELHLGGKDRSDVELIEIDPSDEPDQSMP